MANQNISVKLQVNSISWNTFTNISLNFSALRLGLNMFEADFEKTFERSIQVISRGSCKILRYYLCA